MSKPIPNTIEELEKLLPGQIINSDPKHPMHQLVCEKSATLWHLCYVCVECKGKIFSIWDKSLLEGMKKLVTELTTLNLIK